MPSLEPNMGNERKIFGLKHLKVGASLMAFWIYRIECYCSHKYPSAYTKVTKEECNVPCSGDSGENCGGPLRLSAYDNGIPRKFWSCSYPRSTNTGCYNIQTYISLPVDPQALPNSWYEGCFRDDDKDNRMLKGSWNELTNNSPDICHKLCLKSGYLYFGLTWMYVHGQKKKKWDFPCSTNDKPSLRNFSKECFCGDEVPSEELLLNENECQKQCGGDSNKKCGGGWRLSVYRTGLPGILACTPRTQL